MRFSNSEFSWAWNGADVLAYLAGTMTGTENLRRLPTFLLQKPTLPYLSVLTMTPQQPSSLEILSPQPALPPPIRDVCHRGKLKVEDKRGKFTLRLRMRKQVRG